MPLQRAVERDALTDQPFAVIDQQPQIELGPVQVRDREGLQALLQRDARDAERVDRIGLAALASALASAGRQVRRDPQHPLAAADQKPLQRPRDVPAVLKRPDPLAIQAARPPQQRIEPAPADLDRLLAQQLAGRGRDRGDRVRTLVSVRAKHDHGPRPPLDPRWRRTAGGHGLLEAVPRIYQVTPDIPDRRRATKHEGSQALARPTASKRVSSPPVGTIPSASDVTDEPNHNSKPQRSSGRRCPHRGRGGRWTALPRRALIMLCG